MPKLLLLLRKAAVKLFNMIKLGQQYKCSHRHPLRRAKIQHPRLPTKPPVIAMSK